jgi:hypothetical protein
MASKYNTLCRLVLILFRQAVSRAGIFGPKREEDRLWRKLHNDELHSLYSLLNIARVVIKSRKMRWVGHEACLGEGRAVYRVLVGMSKGKRHWEGLGIGGRITLSWTLGRRGSMG